MRFSYIGLAAMLALAGCVSDNEDTGYTGPHGIGVLVDDPLADEKMKEDPNNWPLCSDGARHPDCRDAPNGY